MNIAKRVWTFFFPPSPWARCQQPSDAERLAAFEIRMGQWRAAERMRQARSAQRFDELASVRVRPKIHPKLPNDNVVVPLRRRQSAA